MDTQSELEGYFRLRERVTNAADRLFAHYGAELQCQRGCYYCCDPITVLPVELETIRRYLLEHGTPSEAQLGDPQEDRGDTPPAILERDAWKSVGDRTKLRSYDRSAEGIFAPVRTETSDKRGRAAPPDITATRRCAFLGTVGECTIYETRPLICRTHGLPLAYRVYEYDVHGREMNPDAPEYLDLWCDLNFRTLSDETAPEHFSTNGRINMDDIDQELDELNGRFLSTDAARRYAARLGSTDRLSLSILLE